MTTILLGKECSTFLETEESVLQRSEVRLVWAETVDSFVPLAREHQPDIVVLDPHVAGVDAFTCAGGSRGESRGRGRPPPASVSPPAGHGRARREVHVDHSGRSR